MNRSALTAAALLTMLVPAALAQAPAAAVADLQPGFTPGQTGQWTITRTIAEKSRAIVAETESTLTATIECTTEVRSLRGEGGVVVQVAFTRIAGEGTGDEWTGAYDSARPETDETTNRDDFDRALHGIVGRTADIVLDEFGTVVDIRGLDDLQHRDGAAAVIAEAVLGIDALDRSFGPIFAIKTEEPYTVPVGESFEDVCDSLLSVGRVLTRVTLTLDEYKDSIASLSLTGRTELFGQTPTEVSPRITAQEIKGAATWNTARHALTGYDLSIDWTLEAGGTQLPIKVQRTETIAIAPKK